MMHINRVLMLFCVFQITHLYPMGPSSGNVFIPIESGKVGQNPNIEIAAEKIPLLRAQDHSRQIVDSKIPLTCDEKAGYSCAAVMAVCSGLSAVGALTSGIVMVANPSEQWARPLFGVSLISVLISTICCCTCEQVTESEIRHKRGVYSPPSSPPPPWW